MMEKLRVLDENQISPPPGSVTPASLPCTYFDLLYLTRPPGQILFFYGSPHPQAMLPNFKRSLSLALQHYYPLAGNLEWPQGSTKPEIVYRDGDSVGLTVAEYDFGFDQLSDTRATDVELVAPLLARFRDVLSCINEKSVPLIALQVTFFRDKGVCMGITFNHIAADGNTIFGFLKAWASLCTSMEMDLPLPFYDRSNIFDGLKKKEKALLNTLFKSNVRSDTFHTTNIYEAPVPKGMVQAEFRMSFNRIQSLKHWVSTADIPGTPTVQYLSSYSVTCAYTWVCFTKARWGNKSSAEDPTQHLVLPMDIRTRLDSPVPVTYFGNCGASLEVKAKTSELLGEQGILKAARLIGKALQNIDVYAELQKYESYIESLPLEQILAIGSYPKFGAYNINFGWGKPKRVRMNASEADTVVFLNDSPDDGSIEIELVVNPDEVHAFASAFESLGSCDVRSNL